MYNITLILPEGIFNPFYLYTTSQSTLELVVEPSQPNKTYKFHVLWTYSQNIGGNVAFSSTIFGFISIWYIYPNAYPI